MSVPTLEGKGICSGLKCTQCPESSNLDCLGGLCKGYKSYRESGVLEENCNSYLWPLDGGVAEGMAALVSPSLPPPPNSVGRFDKRVATGAWVVAALLPGGSRLSLQSPLNSWSH